MTYRPLQQLAQEAYDTLEPADQQALQAMHTHAVASKPITLATFLGLVLETGFETQGVENNVASIARFLAWAASSYRERPEAVDRARTAMSDRGELLGTMMAGMIGRAMQEAETDPMSKGRPAVDFTPGMDGGVLLTPLRNQGEALLFLPIGQVALALERMKSVPGVDAEEFERRFVVKVREISAANVKEGEQPISDAEAEKMARMAWSALECLGSIGGIFLGFHYPRIDSAGEVVMSKTPQGARLSSVMAQSRNPGSN